MGYGVKFPAHRVGGSKKLWDFMVYGLSESWVMRGSTVELNFVAEFYEDAKQGGRKCEALSRHMLSDPDLIRVSEQMLRWVGGLNR